MCFSKNSKKRKIYAKQLILRAVKTDYERKQNQKIHFKCQPSFKYELSFRDFPPVLVALLFYFF